MELADINRLFLVGPLAHIRAKSCGPATGLCPRTFAPAIWLVAATMRRCHIVANALLFWRTCQWPNPSIHLSRFLIMPHSWSSAPAAASSLFTAATEGPRVASIGVRESSSPLKRFWNGTRTSRLPLPSGRLVEASLAGRDPSTDVAVLRFQPDGLPAASTADAAPLRPGHVVLAVGNHEGAPVASLGIVASVGGPWHSLRGGAIDSLIRVDLVLSPTAEGGALIDAQGRVVGMAVLGPRRRVLAIPHVNNRSRRRSDPREGSCFSGISWCRPPASAARPTSWDAVTIAWKRAMSLSSVPSICAGFWRRVLQ